MASHPIIRALQTVFLLSVAGFAQTTPAPNPPAAPCPAQGQPQDQKPCAPQTPAARRPSVAEQFPFPGQPAKPVSPPDSPAPKTAPSDAATEHPFPTQPPPKLPGDDSSSSSSSGSDDPDNPSDIGPPLKDEGTEGTSTRRKLPKVQKVQSDDERVDEDLNVAKLYMNDENYPGAYLRAKDAVKTQPDYSTPHFALALAALKMKKKDEAVAEFQTYLKLDPEGEKAKAARKALDELK
jgi:hypothetical protein